MTSVSVPQPTRAAAPRPHRAIAATVRMPPTGLFQIRPRQAAGREHPVDRRFFGQEPPSGLLVTQHRRGRQPSLPLHPGPVPRQQRPRRRWRHLRERHQPDLAKMREQRKHPPQPRFAPTAECSRRSAAYCRAGPTTTYGRQPAAPGHRPSSAVPSTSPPPSAGRPAPCSRHAQRKDYVVGITPNFIRNSRVRQDRYLSCFASGF